MIEVNKYDIPNIIYETIVEWLNYNKSFLIREI